MERLLQYVWKYRLYRETDLITTNGEQVSVIDPGMQNTNAGPDFFNTKLKIGNTIWAGNVEIHTKASDWFTHNHHHDKVYDSVIMHIVEKSDMVICRTTGEEIPQLILKIPDRIKENIEWLLYRDTPFRCMEEVHHIETVYLSSWMDSLLTERLERKTKDIIDTLQHSGQDWNEALYILLTRNFGFGINSDAFERLARSLPLRYIQKHRANITQVEALFFGQAGLLEEENSNSYYQVLCKEYAFLKHKFNLKPLHKQLYKNMRIRPANFPHIKLAQLAAIWTQYDILFSTLLEIQEKEDVKKIFSVQPSPYWETHYNFGSETTKKQKKPGDQTMYLLLINTVVPLLFAYGKYMDKPEYTDRAFTLLESIPPENNYIIQAFSRTGITPRHAGESQALIQLKREYCEKKKCMYCRIGFQLLKRIKYDKIS